MKKNKITFPSEDKMVAGRIQRQELLNLHMHYEAVIKDELDFFFKYFNFYVGLLSALVVATVAAIINLKNPFDRDIKMAMAVGPVLTIFLSIFAYKFIRVYYRRFLEALVTDKNIKAMLNYSAKADLATDIKIPIRFPSKFGGGFITQFDRKETRKILTTGEANRDSAEDVLDKLLKKGDTFQYAKYTLMLYAVVAMLLLCYIFFIHHKILG